MTIHDMPEDERPISELFRITSKHWIAADHEYRHFEEMKTPELEKRKQALIEAATPDDKMTDAKAERIVKASQEWRDYIRQLVEAKTKANRFQMQMEYIRMRQWEINDANASKRAEMGLTR